MKFADVLKTLSNDQLVEVEVWDNDTHRVKTLFTGLIAFASSNCPEPYGDYEVILLASFVRSSGGSGTGEDYIRFLLGRKENKENETN